MLFGRTRRTWQPSLGEQACWRTDWDIGGEFQVEGSDSFLSVAQYMLIVHREEGPGYIF